MEENTDKVKNYYNDHVTDEDRRLEYHFLEMPLTIRYIERYLKPGSEILDLACGTGRYAWALLNKGYRLYLNDISEENIRIAEKRVSGHEGLLGIECSDVLNRGLWEDRPWDGILLLGPLYHLVLPDDRIKILKKASAALKEKGYLFTAFMSRMLALVFGLKRNPEGIFKEEGVRHLLNFGTDKTFVSGTEWFKNAYFAFPEEIDPLMEAAGLLPLHLIGIEGCFGERMELLHAMDEALKKEWTAFVYRHCEEKHMVQLSKHLLSVSQRP